MKGRVMKWRREKGNAQVRRGRNDIINETGESHVQRIKKMTESRRNEGHMFCECNEKLLLLSISLYWIGEVMTFPIPSCLSIPINAHSMPVIINVQIKHSAVNFSIRHYIIHNTSHLHVLYFQHHVCDKKCATMDHEGPSMSVIIYIDHKITSPLMFTSIPGVERRRSTQVV